MVKVMDRSPGVSLRSHVPPWLAKVMDGFSSEWTLAPQRIFLVLLAGAGLDIDQDLLEGCTEDELFFCCK